MRYALALIGLLAILAACTTIDQENASGRTPAECEPFIGAEFCTEEYAPVCVTYENGSESTASNQCFGCMEEGIIDIREGACEPEPQRASAGLIGCTEPRPEACTREYRPVCGQVDTGVRCITTPCPSIEYETFSNGCTACSNQSVQGYYDGACEDQLFVICEETTTGFSAEDYARDTGGICVDECPSGFDEYTTQIGVRECIAHYGVEDIQDWPACERSSETCECVRTTETTTGQAIEDAQYRCVPEQYATRLLFGSGQERLDERGEASVLIA